MTCFLCLAEMSETPCACEGAAEEVHLNLLPGSGETQNNNNTNQVIGGTVMSSCCNDNHRKLAIWSVICGISCIGIIALINSVKVFSALFLPPALKSLGQRQTEPQALTQKWTPNSRMMLITTGCAAVQLFNQSYCADQPDGWSEGHWPQHQKGKSIHFAFVFRNPKQEVTSTIFSFPLNRHKRWQIQSSPSIFHDGQGSLASSPSWRGSPFWSQFLC